MKKCKCKKSCKAKCKPTINQQILVVSQPNGQMIAFPVDQLGK